MIRNYSTLENAVNKWAHRKTRIDPERMEEFVQLTETHLNTVLRVMDMAQRVRSRTTAEVSFYKFPTGSLGIRNIEIEFNGRRIPLDYYTPESMDQHFGRVTRHGVPVAYTVQAKQYELRPMPAAEYPLRILHYEPIPHLSSRDEDPDTVNWVITKYPTLYLYGCLHYFYVYARDAAAAKEWGDKFANMVGQIIDADAGDVWSGSAKAMRAG